MNIDLISQWVSLSQNLEHCVGETILKEKLTRAQCLRVKLGVDPTRPDLTFGHWVVFNKLKQFQNLGHKVIFLIGDYTTRIGDPSGRSCTRPVLTPEQIAQNAKTYLDQAFKVLDVEKTEVRYNSEWFCKMDFGDLLSLSRQVTVAQLLERDDFTKRYAQNTPIALVEFLYPLLQAYDSVMLQADVELGGTDQLFNMCLGRQFQRLYGQSEQAVMCMPLLVGLDGVRKMSKSYDNYIALNESAKNMFGKIMSLPDEAMWMYFRLLALEPEESIAMLKLEHPMEAKKALAVKLLKQFFTEAEITAVKHDFETVFSQKGIPHQIPEFSRDALPHNHLMDLIVATQVYQGSKKDLKRLMAQGGVEVNGQKVLDPTAKLENASSYVVRVGKHVFFRIVSSIKK
ncbi:MAG: tyrosine--tRNA ligase [Puniceicoccales bacterium]|jgi:tyrosyl-tRNA synthetase|nr:tyrosine--tRNA ligase [Puniceicoccales bacterium]